MSCKIFATPFLFLSMLIGANTVGLINDDAKLRAKPNLFSGTHSMTLSFMDTVVITDSTKSFYEIKTKDFSGWVRKKKVTKIELVEKPVVLKIQPDQIEKKRTSKNKDQKSKSIAAVQKKPAKQVKKKNIPSLVYDSSKVVKSKLYNSPNIDSTKNDNNYSFIIILSLISAGFIYLSIKLFLKLRKVEKKYEPIKKIEEEIDILEKQLSLLKKDISKKESDHEKNVEELKNKYRDKKKVYDRLLNEVAILDETIVPMDFGIYKPKFDFGTSDEFKEKIKENNQIQKEMVKDAIYSKVEVYVLDNKAAGTKMVNTYKKIAIRCFNSETDKVMRQVKWNNVKQSEEKIRKSYEVINKFLESLRMYIKGDYLRVKIDELHLRHEYAEKLYEEKEARREENARIREEERAQKEIEQARLKAERDIELREKALEAARKELGLLSDEKAKEMQEKIQELQEQLEESQQEKERMKSMAQLTRSGHVYIISNLGSFGEQVYKIGLTRRLEPMDRVKELGDASVPFSFDVHALIYSEDAPALEKQLHKIFDDKRVNQINRRKEFFNVSIDEIEKEIKKFDSDVDFISVSEAKEYYQTLSLLEQKVESEQKVVESTFPDTI